MHFIGQKTNTFYFRIHNICAFINLKSNKIEKRILVKISQTIIRVIKSEYYTLTLSLIAATSIYSRTQNVKRSGARTGPTFKRR